MQPNQINKQSIAMERKITKLTAIVFALLMQCTFTFAHTDEPFPVDLLWKDKKKDSTITRPSHAPSRNNLSLSIIYDDANQNIVFNNEDCSEVAYSIIDSESNVLYQGSFSCRFYSTNISFAPSGLYTIEVTCNGVTYEGMFEIE